ncbi:MAG TPA: GDP-mannose 4,6-dehydratase, partial [Pirellula sp.]|nr:GDP-mannose 4,6-dehydratase [Pirellula sp.]
MEPRILAVSPMQKREQLHSRILVTGGAGFIGSNLVRMLIRQGREVLCFDKLSYAGYRQSLVDVVNETNLHWDIADLCDLEAVRSTVAKFQPHAVMHLAAESHVDRSIEAPLVFTNSNVVGTVNLLETVREYWSGLSRMGCGRLRWARGGPSGRPRDAHPRWSPSDRGEQHAPHPEPA